MIKFFKTRKHMDTIKKVFTCRYCSSDIEDARVLHHELKYLRSPRITLSIHILCWNCKMEDSRVKESLLKHMQGNLW